MSSFLVAISFTFAGSALLAVTAWIIAYEAFIEYPEAVRERLNSLNGKSSVPKKSLLLDFRRLAESASNAPSNWRIWTRDLLEQSGLGIEMRTVLATASGIGVAASIATWLLTQQWWTAPLGAALGFSAPWAYVWFKRRARFRRLTLQLPDALDFISRAVRAGQTVPATFQMVGDNFPAPISDEFRYCYEQQNLGISFDTALRNMARSTGIMELRILVVALLIQARSGGQLTELLQNLSTIVRKRLVLQQKVKACTGEGRMQAAVLIALPFLVFASMYLLNRDYAQVLLDRPWLLGGCVVSQSIGAALIYKLIQIKY